MKDIIKDSVNIMDIINKYGLKTDRRGFINCLEHKDKTPSVKIYEKSNSCHCFSCGKSFDVIGLVQSIFNIDFKTAVNKINQDFGLGVNSYTKIDKIALKRLQKERELKLKQEKIKNDKILHLCDIYRQFYKAIKRIDSETNKWNWEVNTKIMCIYKMEMEKIDMKLEEM